MLMMNSILTALILRVGLVTIVSMNQRIITDPHAFKLGSHIIIDFSFHLWMKIEMVCAF